MPDKDVPEKLRPFADLGFVEAGKAGEEVFGDCVFCGKAKKMYVNTSSGQWSCKAGSCAKNGNIYTFLQLWWKMLHEQEGTADYERRLEALSTERKIPVEAIRRAGLVWDGVRWAIPIRNPQGKMVSFRFYRKGYKVRALTGMDLGLWNGDALSQRQIAGSRVWLIEGEFDGIALQYLLEGNGSGDGSSDVVVGVPGAETFKSNWAEWFSGRDLVVAYDNDVAGRNGVRRVWRAVGKLVRSFKWLAWLPDFADGFDIRDFRAADGTSMELLEEMVSEYDPSVDVDKEVGGAGTKVEVGKDPTEDWPRLADGGRARFSKVLATYKKWLTFTPEMEDALRIIFATTISNQIPGDPLWIHIAAPPGTAKTELLMTLSQTNCVKVVSTITPHTLISGFQGPGGSDPSLIPQLDGMVCVFKDFTEILRMPKVSKDEVYSILRGAFDGQASKPFGNGVVRQYKSHFSLLTGVTQAVFAEQGASLGERFLIYHLVKGVGFDASDMIAMAIGNGGHELEMREEMQMAARDFLQRKVCPEDVPQLPARYVARMVGLSQLVAMLRATVEKDTRGEKMLYRPQHESGTRLGKQLKKLLLGLAMLGERSKDPATGEMGWVVTDECYRIVVRVAIDSCVGFNLEALQALAKRDGQTGLELEESVGLPLTTLRDQLDDLVQLGVLYKKKIPNPNGRGAPMVQYWRTETIKRHWNQAGMDDSLERKTLEAAPKVRIKRGTKRSWIKGIDD